MAIIVFKPDCAYPRWVSAVFLPQNCFILILFIDFYIKNYIKKSPAQQIADLQKKISLKSNCNYVSGNENDRLCSANDDLKMMEQEPMNTSNKSHHENHDTPNRVTLPQNATQSSLKVSSQVLLNASCKSSQNRNHRSQSASPSSQNECHSFENGSSSDHYINDGKHGKSE